MSTVAAARSGDHGAFRVLVERYQNRVFAVLRRLTGDPDAAEDLAQEAFLRAFRGLGSFKGESSFGTWVVQIAVHAARDTAKRESRLDVVSIDQSPSIERAVSAVADARSEYDPFEELVATELEERLESLVVGLPPLYREAFVLRVVEGLSYEEVSHVTGDSVGSIKVRVHRARGMLTGGLSGQGPHRRTLGGRAAPNE